MTYTSADIKIKSDIEYVRMRPRVYLGERARNTAAREIIDNAVDEYARGHSTMVEVIFHPDNSIEVRDDGRGIPVDYDTDISANGIVKALSYLQSGGNFENAGLTAGTNGVGATAANAISQRFDVTVYRDGKKYVQQFKQGEPGTFKNPDYDPFGEFTADPNARLRGAKAGKNAPAHGTHIRFIFDTTILADDTLDVDEIVERLQYTARLHDGLTLRITKDGETTEYNGPEYGVAAVHNHVFNAPPLSSFTGEFAYSQSHEAVNPDGTTEIVKTSKNVGFAVSFSITDKVDYRSFVNTVYTPDGGSHADSVSKALGAAAASKRLRSVNLNKGEEYPRPEDFAAVLGFIVNLDMTEPPFVGQDKRKLKTPVACNNAFVRELERQATAWVVSPANSGALTDWANAAVQHARMLRKVKSVRENSKATTNKRLAGSFALPPKFLPSANVGYDSGAELFLCEGDSAATTIESSRDSRFQACFPLRGKQLNSFNTPLGAPVKPDMTCNPRKKKEPITMRTNESFVAIERILGTGVREHCDPEKGRFSRIIFATDADPDGANISAQLMCMFYFNFKPLIDAGMVYVAVPPLFVVEPKKGTERFYAIDATERDEIVSNLLERDGTRPHIKRCKGLGEMTADEFYDTVMDPARRVLRRVIVDDAAYKVLEMAFGSDPQGRRDIMAELNERGLPEGDI